MEFYNVSMVVRASATILHPLWCYIFINQMGLGIIAVGLATNITLLITLLVLIVYIYFSEELHPAIFFPDRETFANFGSFFLYILPGFFMSGLEWGLSEVLTMMATYLGVH